MYNHKRLNRQLTIGILIGLVIGLLIVFDIIPSSLLGLKYVELFRFVGRVFMLLLKMIVVPLVFFSIFIGVSSLGDISKVGKMGARTLIYYFCTTFIACCLGLILVNIIQPGKGNALAPASAAASVAAVNNMNISEIIINQVNSFLINPFEALASGTSAMIAIIISSIILALGILWTKNPKKQAVIDFFNVINDALIEITHMILRVAPYGVCGIIVSVLFDKRDQLGELVRGFSLFALTSYVGLAIHGLIILPLILKIFSKRKVRQFFSGIGEAMKVAFGTDSSVAAIPVTLGCLQDNLGVSKKTSDFVIPLGATINMDGTALYEAVCALFIAQVLGIDLTIFQQIVVFLTATIASVGAAGIPSAGLVTLVIVINAVGIPYDQATPIIGMIFAIDRFIDVIRTMVNVEGDCVGSVIIDEMVSKNSLK